MANYMAGVAKLLGVEVGEVFEVYVGGECQGRCRFTKDRVEVLDNHCWYRTKAETLEWLLNGTATIVKLPRKPSYGDVFYMPSVINENKYIRLFWHDSGTYKSFYQQGMVCRTKEEAIKLAEEMLNVARKKFAGDK